MNEESTIHFGQFNSMGCVNDLTQIKKKCGRCYISAPCYNFVRCCAENCFLKSTFKVALTHPSSSVVPQS